MSFSYGNYASISFIHRRIFTYLNNFLINMNLLTVFIMVKINKRIQYPFSLTQPLGRLSLLVAMSVCLSICDVCHFESGEWLGLQDPACSASLGSFGTESLCNETIRPGPGRSLPTYPPFSGKYNCCIRRWPPLPYPLQPLFYIFTQPC